MGYFLRTYATPLSLAGFGAVGISGALMFFGVRNHQLSELHEWLGIVFLLVALLHICRNWRAMLAMMAKTSSKIVIAVLGTVAILLIGTALLTGGPGHGPGDHGPGDRGPRGRGLGRPIQTVEMRLGYTPIAQLAPAFGLSTSQAIGRLRQSGITVAGPGQNLTDISQKQNIPVGRLLAIIAQVTDEPEDD